ncbi:unnamed protein product [Caenorhabditis angaria]|uniref:C-type lectin domain-containing protein n=1 Tax=Caenorhabditis angaria TaxID=860376 RepID=A0A9P1IEQ5_9PELO|nr:unnamed protein product [Caenorhabditis angaria]
MLIFRALYWSIIILTLLVGDSAQYIRDKSFLKFCGNVGSNTVTVQDEKSPEADTCEVTWQQFPASDDEEAMLYCKNWGPYSVLEAKKDQNGKSWCKYQNVYSCDDKYTQINGFCYQKMTNKVQTYEEAQKICKKQTITTQNGVTVKSKVLQLYDLDLIRLIRAYFIENTQIIVEPNKELDEFVEFDDGVKESDETSKYIVVLDASIHYSMGQGALIRLPGNTRWRIPSQVFCVYKAEETPLSFGVKAKMLEPYYYKTVIAGFMTVWRTSSHYSHMRHFDSSFPVRSCSASLNALTPNGGDIWDAKKENVDRLTPEMKQQFVKSTAPYFHCCYHWWDMNNRYYERERLVYQPRNYENIHSCFYQPAIDARHSMYHSEVGCKGQSSPSNVASTSSFLFTPEKVGDYDISEKKVAHDAPLLCSIFYRVSKVPTACPPTWRKYVRKNGTPTCVAYFFEKAVTYTEAVAKCRRSNAEVITFSDQEEIDHIKSYNRRIWIGMKRRPGCLSRQSSGQCDKRNFGVWDNSYGEDTEAVKDLVSAYWSNTDAFDQTHDCIYLEGGKLYDWECNGDSSVMCISGYQTYET